MTETARMFQPLSAEEVAAAEPGHDQKPKPVPIVPVPADAPPMQYRHREHGGPTSTWAYHNAQGQIVGYILRWDFTGSNGKPAKDILPVCYCNLSDGRRAWRSVGMPAPRPLLRLPDVLARSSARVLVLEGEKAADAAAKLFEGPYQTTNASVTNTTNTSIMVTDLVATTPPHGANSPQMTDWTPLEGRHVTIWPDNDKSGARVCRGCLAPLYGLRSGVRGHCASATRLPAQVGPRGPAARGLDGGAVAGVAGQRPAV